MAAIFALLLFPYASAQCPKTWSSQGDWDSGTKASVDTAASTGDVVLASGAADASTKLLMHFNEGTGTTASDSSGNGNNGTLTNGPTWTSSGVFGNALHFDGVDDHVLIPNSAGLGPNVVTAAAWVKLDSYPGGSYGAVIGKYGGSNGYLLSIRPDGQAQFWVGNDAVSIAAYTWATTLQLNTWYHVAGTYDGSAVKIYLNGALGMSWNGSNALNSAAYDPSLGSQLNGTIDEAVIYNRALSAGEIAALYSGAYASSGTISLDFDSGAAGTTFPQLLWNESFGASAIYARNSTANEAVISGLTTEDLHFAFCDGSDTRLSWSDTGTGSSHGAGPSENWVSTQRTPNNNGCGAWEGANNNGAEECTVICASPVPTQREFTSDPSTTLLEHFNGATTGTNSGYTFSTGKFGQGVYADNSADKISWPGAPPVSGTIEFWIYLTAEPTENRFIFNNRNGSGYDSIHIKLHQDRSIAFIYNASGQNVLITGGQIPINSWTHVAASYGNGQPQKLWIKGVLAAEGTATANHVSNCGDSCISYGLGNHLTNPSDPETVLPGIYNAYIDELRISNVRRNYTEIKSRIKVADSSAGLDSAAWSSYFTNSPATLNASSGRYARVEATLETSNTSYTPILQDLTLSCTATNQAPTASFTASKYSANALETITFTSTSTDADGTIAGYDWNWGDSTAHGNTSSATHSYSAPGTYAATLTVTDNLGATASATATINISAAPTVFAGCPAHFTTQADFAYGTLANTDITASPGNILLNKAIAFYDNFDDGAVSGIWKWQAYSNASYSETSGKMNIVAADGDISAGYGFLYIDDVKGDFTAKTKLDSFAYCSGQSYCGSRISFLIRPKVGAEWAYVGLQKSPTGTCLPYCGAAYYILAHDYSGRSVSIQVPSFSYPYYFKIARAGSGISMYYSADGITWNALSLPAGFFSSAADLQVGFAGDGRGMGSFDWFDLSAASIGSYASSGTWLATVDAQAQSIFSSLSWTAEKPANTDVKFRIRTADTQSALDSAAWSIFYTASAADLSTYAGYSNKRFAQVEATLETTDPIATPTLNDLTLNCSAYNQAPTASASANKYSAIQGETIAFDGSASYDSDGTIVSYAWDFGDGGGAGSAAATHIYSIAGNYTVTLTVTDNLGGTDSDSIPITITQILSGCPGTWTTKAQWEYGIANNVDTTSSPDDVKLASSQLSGSLQLDFDATANAAFSSIGWNATKPANTNVKFRIKSANTADGLATASWSAYYTSAPATLSNQNGRYAKIEAALETTDAATTPSLHDLTLYCQVLSESSWDLSIDSFSVYPGASVPQSTAISFSAAIRNNSAANITQPFNVGLYLGTGAGTLLQSVQIAQLQANSTAAVEFPLVDTSALSGDALFTLFADNANSINEQNENNNQQGITVTISPPTNAPDFTISSAGFSPASVASGTAATLNATVKNIGNVASGAVNIALYRGTSQSGVLLQTKTINALAVNESAQISFTGVSTSALSGIVSFAVYADYDVKISEQSETNNTATAQLLIIANLPDLIVSGLVASKLLATPGEIITLTATIQNIGMQAVQSAIEIGLFEKIAGAPARKDSKSISASRLCTQDGAQINAALCGIAAAAAAPLLKIADSFSLLFSPGNESEMVQFSVDTSGKTGSVAYDVNADSTNSTAESDETNNSRGITITMSSANADLWLKSISAPKTLAKGSPAAITATMQNIGQQDAGTFNVRAYRAENGMQYDIGTVTIQGLASGASATAQFTFDSAGLDGTVAIHVVADSSNSVDEGANENNNSATASILIKSGEICNNAVDDDGDALIDQDDPECIEVCGDGTDNDLDGGIDEGCGEICGNGIDDNDNGEADEGCANIVAEICGNSIDDDLDGLVDEENGLTGSACPFIFLPGKDSDNDGITDEDEVTKYHTNPEDADSDDDCVMDGQEIKYDLTDPIDMNSNLIVVDITREVPIGEKAEIRAKHPMLGTIKNTSAEISWQHKKVIESSDAEGLITYEPLEIATYDVRVQVCANRIKSQFSAVAAGLTMQQFLTNIAKLLFGKTIVEAPLLLILLVVLCGIAAVLTYRYSYYLFGEGAKSSEERKREMLARALLSVIAFILPLAVNRFVDFYAAAIIAIAEMLLIIMFGYFKGSMRLKSAKEEF
ncbi:MAG: PKD domain-containing protein [Candidatus Diapherotrites archaeon]|nr:PKD domain-containing protein [Candidatus Diapherotrites archaeon]